MRAPFVGPSYLSRSPNWDAERCINLHPVKGETGNSKTPWMLAPTPGLRAFTTLPESPVRGMRKVKDRTFAVGGNTLYEIFVDGTYTERGDLTSSTGQVSMSDNGAQLVIVDGPSGYVLTLSTNVFTDISGETGWLGATTVTFLDGYFIFNAPDSQTFYISALYNVTIDPLDFASAESSPDNIVAVKAVHEALWAFGSLTTQVFYNSGDADFPFAPVAGATMQYGCAAPFTVVTSANSVFWLGQDEDGSGVVFMANGYAPQRISTHAVEYAIGTYNDISQAYAYTYQEDGHYFYVLNFQNADTTWVYDVSEGQWHERAYFSDGQYSRHRALTHVYAYGKHLVGDYETGLIYEMSMSYLDDNGEVIRRQRTAPVLHDDENNYVTHNSFQLDLEAGVGIVDGAPEDADPQIMLTWSNDGGHTWSSERWVSAGKVGKYGARALWRRLGRARNRIYTVATTARTRAYWMGAIVDVEQGTN